MSYLGRKLDKLPRWKTGLPGLVGAEVGASAITSDLRDAENKLSLWEFADASMISELALAIVSSWKRADRCITAWVELEELTTAGIRLERSRGVTPVADLRGTHFDAVGLDGKRLLVIADLMARSIRSTRFRLFAEAEVIGIVAGGVNAGRLTLDDLQPDLRLKVQARTER